MEDAEDPGAGQDYVLDEQVGYMLRRAYQRNSLIFSNWCRAG